MSSPIILLPPSEGKAPGGSGEPYDPSHHSFAELDPARRKAIAALRRAMTTNATVTGKLLGVKGSALAAARATNRRVLTAPTMPAIERYTGVLYGELDYASLSATHRKRAAQQIVIFSGLWGAVGPSDPLPDYKLKMGASLDKLGRMATYWRPHVTAALADRVAGQTVWDLLPNEHAAGWNPSSDALRQRISVKFLDDSPVKAGAGPTGERMLVAVNHWNKLLKGALVRHILATQLDEPDGLTEFNHPLGYRYRPDLTTVTDGRTEISLVAFRD